CSPIGRTTMTGYIKIAGGRDDQIGQQHGAAGDRHRRADVAIGSFHKSYPPYFSARKPGDEGVAFPPIGTEGSMPSTGLVEYQPTCRLMLRAKGHDGRLVDYRGKILCVSWRKAVVLAW